MKCQSAMLCCLAWLFCGCASTMKTGGVSISKPSEIDIYNAKVAYCDVFSYEDVTRYIGIDSRESPATRKERKDSSWIEWENNRKELKAELIGKRFFLSHPAAFADFDEKTQHLELWEQGHIRKDFSAVPNKVLFNIHDKSLSLSFGLAFPSGASRGVNSGSTRQKAFAKYGNSQRANKSTYVINNIQEQNLTKTYRSGHYGGVNGSTSMFGVSLDTNKWYERDDSPIIKKEGTFYLDATKFNFLDVFEMYPDIGTFYMKISYIFEFKGCSGNIARGEMKEVVLTTNHLEKELYRVAFK